MVLMILTTTRQTRPAAIPARRSIARRRMRMRPPLGSLARAGPGAAAVAAPAVRAVTARRHQRALAARPASRPGVGDQIGRSLGRRKNMGEELAVGEEMIGRRSRGARQCDRPELELVGVRWKYHHRKRELVLH